MKKFVKHILWFVLPVVVLLVAGELYMRSIPNIYRYKDQWMRSRASDVEVLVLGNSHSFDGISPSRLSCKAFNLAMPNQTFEEDYFMLTNYGPGCDSLKTVIVQLDECNLVLPSLEEMGYNDRATYYRIYMGYDKHSRWSLYNFEMSNPATCWRKAKRYRQAKRDGGNDLGCDSLGFSPQGELQRGGNEDAEFLTKMWQKVSVVRENVRKLAKISDYCRDHGLHMLLITMPYKRSYVANLDRNMVKMVRMVGEQEGKKPHVTYINFQGDDRIADSDFIDNSHLTTSGAMKFSAIIDSVLVAD